MMVKKPQGMAASAVKERGRGRMAALLVTVAGAVVAVVWFCGGFSSTPKEVLQIRALVDAEVAKLKRVARNELPYDDEWPSVGGTIGRMRDLPEKTREQVRVEMGRLFRARERAELASYFALPPDKRRAELDRRIKADQDRRKAWEQQRANRVASGGASRNQSTQRPQGGPAQGQPDGRPSRGGGGGPPGGGSVPPAVGLEEAMNARRKQRLDSSTPEERSRASEYRRAMEIRRAQLGIAPRTGRGA